MRTLRAGAATCLVMLFGCGTGSGASSPAGGAGGAGGTHVSVDGLSGGGASIGAGGGTGILGGWRYATGKTTRVCPNEQGTDAPPEGGIMIAAGTSATEVLVSEPGACTLHFDLSAGVATAAPDQTCGGPDGAGGQITFGMMAWTLTLSSDGQTLAETLAADETLAPASGPARTCKFTESGVTLRRAP